MNLAAQAGFVTLLLIPIPISSLILLDFYNILEACRHSYDDGGSGGAFSICFTSLYINKQTPYSPDDKVDNPVSLYAATKKSNELLAYSYAKLYNIPSTGLRFFTVYGPAGRPDMAYFGFGKYIT